MNDFIYGIIDGSYLHGLANENSDVDIIEIYHCSIHKPETMTKVAAMPDVKDEKEICQHLGLYNWRPSRQIYDSNSFLYNLFYEQNFLYYRWLFPHKWLSDNELTDYVKKFNEDIAAEDKASIFERALNASYIFTKAAIQENNLKLFAKGLQFLLCLLEYQCCGSYQESLHFPNYRNLLIDVRAGKYSFTEMNQMRLEYLKKAKEIVNFYKQPGNDYYRNQLIQKVNTTYQSKFYV